VALADEIEAELVDQGRFAGTGNAADADPDGVAGMRQQPVEQRLRALLILRLGALDQGDGARKRHPVAGADGLGDLLNVVLYGVIAAHGMRVGGNQP
jgi:hypothetical protein